MGRRDEFHAGRGIEPLPPDVGEAPIPDDHIRLFHHTSSIEALHSIKQEGIDANRARGDGGWGWGNEPSAGVWASTRPPKNLNNMAVVEFHAHPDEISGNAESPWHPEHKKDPRAWAEGGERHVIMKGSVSPDQIVGAHEPWHHRARFLENEPAYRPRGEGKDAFVSGSGIEQVLGGDHDSLLDDPEYGPAIKYIKQKYGGQ